MELNRVSFKVAKAIKEAGYPQGNGQYYAEDGLIVTKDKDTKFLCRYYIPSYIEAWLWLWREKNIQISPSKGLALSKINDQWENLIPRKLWKDYTDPEEAIIAAIKYLVTNNLIK